LENVNVENEDEKVWVEIIKQAITYPAKQIADNAGYKGDVVVEKVATTEDFNYGFNAKTGEYSDLLSQWVIDPAKVIRVALQNAVSAAKMLLTTETVIAEKPTPPAPPAPPAPMWGMWMPWMGMM